MSFTAGKAGGGVKTEIARSMFDEWAATMGEEIAAGRIPPADASARERARFHLLARALGSEGDRRSVWLAFHAGWLSSLRVIREGAEELGASLWDEEDD